MQRIRLVIKHVLLLPSAVQEAQMKDVERDASMQPGSRSSIFGEETTKLSVDDGSECKGWLRRGAIR
jgi:hypothetical protein